jgi:hypothetical protein
MDVRAARGVRGVTLDDARSDLCNVDEGRMIRREVPKVLNDVLPWLGNERLPPTEGPHGGHDRSIEQRSHSGAAPEAPDPAP